jgi:cation-dependent mannose-6-phosphate receptor
MQPPHLISLLPLLLLGASPSLAAEEAPEPTFLPCTTKSSSSGNFYDLRPISVALIDPSKKLGSSKTDSWHAKGHDYPGNFTLNICAPVVEELGKNNLPDVVGVDKDLWRNVSAYYEVDGKAFSIGYAHPRRLD